MKIRQFAADTRAWPLYEAENWKYKINFRPKEKKPDLEWLKPQGGFRSFFREENAWMLEGFHKAVERDREELNRLAEITA